MARIFIGRVAVVLVSVAVMLAGLVSIAAPAQAQEDRYATCAAYNTISAFGGQAAAEAAVELQAIGAPNPFGLDNVLDVIINAEADAPPIGSRPTEDARQAAYQGLDDYFGGVCADIDVCPLIVQAIAPNGASSKEAARLAVGLTAPAPPGIDAALRLVAGMISESPIHESPAEARAQLENYFQTCAATAEPTPAPEPGVLATCADLSVLGVPEGPRAIAAAESLRARGAPNPPGIDAALDVLINSASTFDEADAAYQTLLGYFGGACQDIDRCPLVAQVIGADLDRAAQAASLLWRLETPAPPGIGAALALIAGEIDESPFHNSVTEAQQQIGDYYPCVTLAFTGPGLAAPLSVFGLGLMGAGAGVLLVRRRLTVG